MRPPLRPGACPHCHRPIVWGTLQNGRNRTFEPDPKPIAEVGELDRYAYDRRYGAVVDLNGARNPPPFVLAAHYCAEYAHAKLMRNVEQVGDVIERVLPPF